MRDHEDFDWMKTMHEKNKDPFVGETMSEINDEKEKNAIFHHSLKEGLFNDLRNSPLKKRMPGDLQMYNPALERRLFARESSKVPGAPPRIGDKHYDVNEGEGDLNKDLMFASTKNLRFKEFKPRADDENANNGLNFDDDF